MRLAPIAVALLLVVSSACSPDTEVPETSPDVGVDEVSFSALDGVTLTGRLYGRGTIGVVLAHSRTASDGAESWDGPARKLADLGYRVIALNFRGYATSKGQRDASKNDIDVRAAYDFLRETNVAEIILVGASTGGAAAIAVAADIDTPAVVTVSAPTRIDGIDIADEAPDVRAPVLLLAAESDTDAADAARTLEQLLPDARSQFYDGDAHGTDLFESHPEALDTMLDFLVEHVPPEDLVEPVPIGQTPEP